MGSSNQGKHAATIFYVFMGSSYIVSVANKTGFEDGKNGVLIEIYARQLLVESS
ncbi:MAG: hypothetical protein WA364_27290 [Candidatus Nitrosopolaris sp.]